MRIADFNGSKDSSLGMTSVAEEVEKRTKWTLELAIIELDKLLRNAKEDNVYGSYVRKNKKGLYGFLHKNFKGEDVEIAWNLIVPMISAEAGKKLCFSRTMETAIKEFVILLESSSTRVMPEQIKKIRPYLYKFLRNHSLDAAGKVDWFLLRNKLPGHLKDKFEISSRHICQKLVDRLSVIIEAADELVTPKVLLRKHRPLYNRFKIYFPDEYGKIDWYSIHKKIDIKLKNRFGYKRTKASSLKELNELLNEKKPTKINSTYIKEKLDGNLFDFLRQNFRNPKGYMDWVFIVNHLNSSLRGRFSYPKRCNMPSAENQYEDENEIKRVLGNRKKYLYTFFHAREGEEFANRNSICISLINLAKRGNKAAEKELMGLMHFAAEKWADEINTLNVFKYHKDRQHDVIRRCIYNYRSGNQFVNYVFKSLRYNALGLERMQEVDFELSNGRLF